MDLKGYIYCTKIAPNPDYPASNIYTLPFADARVFSCLPDGSPSSAPAGSKGQPQTGQQTGHVAVFQLPSSGAPVFVAYGVLMVNALWP